MQTSLLDRAQKIERSKYRVLVNSSGGVMPFGCRDVDVDVDYVDVFVFMYGDLCLCLFMFDFVLSFCMIVGHGHDGGHSVSR